MDKRWFELGEEIAETAAMIDAATHRFLTKLREFDRVGGWFTAGALSCAHWLSWRVGMDLGAAREKVRVARALEGLPLIDDALKGGEISYSKVRAMTRVANAKNEEMLLVMARRMPGAQLEKTCRLVRQVRGLDEGARPDEEDCRRYVTSRATDDGMVSIQVRLFPEEAARVLRAFEAAAEGGKLVDGAMALADGGLGGGRGRPPVEVVLHVEAESLEGHTEAGDGISAEACRRVLCDCGLVPMVEERGKTIDVGRKTRTIPAALRRALESRDERCRFPGCVNRRWLDGHHVVHWLEGGETSLANTLLLCRKHHRYVHEYGFTTDGEVFRDRQGNVIPPQGERPRWAGDWRVPGVSAESNQPGWEGEQVNYELCVDAVV